MAWREARQAAPGAVALAQLPALQRLHQYNLGVLLESVALPGSQPGSPQVGFLGGHKNCCSQDRNTRGWGVRRSLI